MHIDQGKKMPHTTPTRSGLAYLTLAVAALAFFVPANPAAASSLDKMTGKTVRGNGVMQQQTRAPGHFDAVALDLAGNLELRLGNSDSVTIESDGNLLALIETVIEDGTLKIRTSPRHANIAPTRLRIVVQAKNIEHLTVAGSGSIEADSLRGPRLKLDVGGSGSIHVKALDSAAVSVSIGGSGSFSGAGHAGRLSVAIGGSGRVQAGQLAADEVQVSIGGSGQALVWAKRQLHVSVGGSGDVDYYGDPQVSTSLQGSGRVKRIGSAPG